MQYSTVQYNDSVKRLLTNAVAQLADSSGGIPAAVMKVVHSSFVRSTMLSQVMVYDWNSIYQWLKPTI